MSNDIFALPNNKKYYSSITLLKNYYFITLPKLFFNLPNEPVQMSSYPVKLCFVNGALEIWLKEKKRKSQLLSSFQPVWSNFL
jgi:hypothetical protein